MISLWISFFQVHDEMKNLDRTQFMFQDKQYSREYAQTLAENLHSYAPEHILDGKFISGEYMTYCVYDNNASSACFKRLAS